MSMSMSMSNGSPFSCHRSTYCRGQGTVPQGDKSVLQVVEIQGWVDGPWFKSSEWR